jgi:hypothetical protein
VRANTASDTARRIRSADASATATFDWRADAAAMVDYRSNGTCRDGIA